MLPSVWNTRKSLIFSKEKIYTSSQGEILCRDEVKEERGLMECEGDKSYGVEVS